MITIKPYGGLGNRLRSVDSAIALSECTGKKLEVIWDSNEELNCPFSELFKVPDNFSLKEVSTNYLPRKINEKISIVLHALSVNYPFSYNSVLHEKDISKLKATNYNFCNQEKFRKVFISINGRFLFPQDPYHYLEPVEFIKKKVDTLTDRFTTETVGVHIRRTDNDLAIQNSPLEKFLELMDREKSSNPGIKFYLSTDSPETEQIIMDKFPDEVTVYNKELRRDKKEGIQDALIDLLCLSSTSKIIGSYWSSFSDVASEMGKVPLIIAGKNQ